MYRIDLLLDRVAEVCPLPKTAERLLQLTASERANITEVAQVIATDPALAAAVFRIANSAIFGRGKVDRLETAIMRLGMRDLHDLAAAMSLFAAFRNRGELLVNLHDRSVLSGAVAHRLAKAMGGVQPNVAFTCGLLSEIGAMVCLSVDGKEYSQVWLQTVGMPLLRCERERERYGLSTYAVGSQFLRRHLLPENLCDAVGTESDADFAQLDILARIGVLARMSMEVIVLTGREGPSMPGSAIEGLAALPDSLRGDDLDAEKLFELCVQAGATAQQALRTVR